MEINKLDCFKAKVNYHRTDDLKENSPKNGHIVVVQANWIAGHNENFAGEWIFSVLGFVHTLPQRDLELLYRVESQVYYSVMNQITKLKLFPMEIYCYS